MEIIENLELKNNTIIKFDLKNGISGTGVIKGLANYGSPIIGKSYIIEILTSYGIKQETYPYQCMIVFECFIELM